VIRLVADHRFVTLTGMGGIGKTRLALEVARHLLPQFAGGVWVAELAHLSDPQLVPVIVAAALGLELAAGAVSPERISAALGSKHIMLVLDNCEHVIDAAAGMVEPLLHANPAARVIATSREPLRAESERLYRVPPLAVPVEDTQASEDLVRHGAVALFVARAQAADPHIAPDRQTAAMISSICRQLDGIPLAIELAAARASTLGVQKLASRLDDRFNLLTEGRRTALPRHQTLRATFDWSYELLPESERVVLRRLSIFAGGFTLEAALAVIANADILESNVVEGVVHLVTKSLVAADVGGAVVRYWLLETTRAYAREKLTEHGELEQAAGRHAEYYRDLCGQAEAEWETWPASEWLAAYGREIGNIRAALDWAYSPRGDKSIGVALTAASVPLWFQLSLIEECHRRVEQALSLLGPGPHRDARRGMQLYAALGASLLYTKGPVRETGAAWATALEIAQNRDDTEYQLRAFRGLWACRITTGEYRIALAFAQKFRDLAGNQADPADLLIGERMIGTVLHFLGDQPNARRHIERMLAHYVAPAHRSHIIRFQYDQRVAGRADLALILWLQGFPDQAMRAAQNAIDDARAIDHALSLCYALAQAACPVALSTGDLAAAEHWMSMLLDYSARHALTVWHARGRCFNGAVWIMRGDADTGLRLLRAGIDELRETGFASRFTAFLAALAEGLASAGQLAEGLATIHEALARSERNEDRWCFAWLLRIKGELVRLQNGPCAAATAERHFRQALEWARRQGALSWELRAATSLARMWRNQGWTKEARELLAPVYDRFTEGFGSLDLKIAKSLLDQLDSYRT
jgi:predicted ATPase